LGALSKRDLILLFKNQNFRDKISDLVDFNKVSFKEEIIFQAAAMPALFKIREATTMNLRHFGWTLLT